LMQPYGIRVPSNKLVHIQAVDCLWSFDPFLFAFDFVWV
jgi:hypothetical protein